MYCSSCGKEINQGDRYCSGCGSTITESRTNDKFSHIDKDKIFKRDKFKLWKKKNMGLSESGTLTLFKDRLYWEGYKCFTLPIDKIINVSVRDSFGTSNLLIYDDEPLPYRFQITSRSTVGIALFADLGLAAMADKKISETEIWRQMIDKLRLDLL